MNDFILPSDIREMGEQLAADVANAWMILERMCHFKGYPVDIARTAVGQLIFDGLSEPEAIRRIYHEVRKS
jgi:hypothetical protein